MKKTTKIMMLAAMMFIGTAAFAGPRGGHHHRDGLDLAAGIVGLVMQVLNPQPTVVVTPPPAVIHHRPAVVTPPRQHNRPAPKPEPRHRPAPRRR